MKSEVKLNETREEWWLNGSAPERKSVVAGSNPVPPHTYELRPCVVYRMLVSEGLQRYKNHNVIKKQKTENIYNDEVIKLGRSDKLNNTTQNICKNNKQTSKEKY